MTNAKDQRITETSVSIDADCSVDDPLIGRKVLVDRGLTRLPFNGWLGVIASVVRATTGLHCDVRFFDSEETLSFRAHELRLIEQGFISIGMPT